MPNAGYPVWPCRGTAFGKKRWRNPAPSGNKHNGHALTGHGFPFPKVGVAVDSHAKCGYPVWPCRGTAFGKKRWRNPTPNGNKHNGHALTGHGFPFPEVGVAVDSHAKCGYPVWPCRLSCVDLYETVNLCISPFLFMSVCIRMPHFRFDIFEMVFRLYC